MLDHVIGYIQHQCLFCWTTISKLQNQLDGLLSLYLCSVCIRGLLMVESPICVCCGLPFKSRQGGDHQCSDCIASPKKFRIARAPLVYEQILTTVIHCFKYKGKVQLAKPLAELLLAAFRLFWEPEARRSTATTSAAAQKATSTWRKTRARSCGPPSLFARATATALARGRGG